MPTKKQAVATPAPKTDAADASAPKKKTAKKRSEAVMIRQLQKRIEKESERMGKMKQFLEAAAPLVPPKKPRKAKEETQQETTGAKKPVGRKPKQPVAQQQEPVEQQADPEALKKFEASFRKFAS